MPEARVFRPDPADEFDTPERCSILEVANEDGDDLSVALARVRPGVTTERHRLAGTVERYLILRGTGRMEVEGMAPAGVGPGDMVRIPAGAAQQIANTGREDLLFYCLCTPRFHPECYERAEDG